MHFYLAIFMTIFRPILDAHLFRQNSLLNPEFHFPLFLRQIASTNAFVTISPVYFLYLIKVVRVIKLTNSVQPF